MTGEPRLGSTTIGTDDAKNAVSFRCWVGATRIVCDNSVMNTPSEVPGGGGRLSVLRTSGGWRRLNLLAVAFLGFALIARPEAAHSSVNRSAVQAANNGNGNNGNNGNGNGNNGDGDGEGGRKTTTTTTRPTTTTTTKKPCKDVDSKKYPPKPCKPKCNAGRGNGSERKNDDGEDCDPGNSGGHNNGGG